MLRWLDYVQIERNVAQNKTNACSIPIVDPQPLASANVTELAPPGNTTS